jgi:hypothetical protein
MCLASPEAAYWSHREVFAALVMGHAHSDCGTRGVEKGDGANGCRVHMLPKVRASMPTKRTAPYKRTVCLKICRSHGSYSQLTQ